MADLTTNENVNLDVLFEQLRVEKTYPDLSDFSDGDLRLGEQHLRTLKDNDMLKEFLKSSTSENLSFADGQLGELTPSAMAYFALKISEDVRQPGDTTIINIHAFANIAGDTKHFLLRSLTTDAIRALDDICDKQNRSRTYPKKFLDLSRSSLIGIFLDTYIQILENGGKGTIFIFIHGLDMYCRKSKENECETQDLIGLLEAIENEEHSWSKKGCVKLLYTAYPKDAERRTVRPGFSVEPDPWVSQWLKK